MQLAQREDAGVMEAYEYCQEITRHASKTFYWGSIFLPPLKRRAIWAVYAFCRVVDDIVDESTAITDKLYPGHLSGSKDPVRELDRWRRTLERIYQRGGTNDGPIQRAWSDMLEQYPVPIEPALELLQGVEMDLTQRRYASFEDLYLYCYRVAGTVGLLTGPIFGYIHDAALAHAVDLGVALQLTNILRDIGEDARNGRIYLPQDEMRHFGYNEADLLNGTINESFRALVHFQMERAEGYYMRAQPGISLLSADCRLAVGLSATLYRSILERIRLNSYNVFTKRASVPLQTKLKTASLYWFMDLCKMGVKDLHHV